MMRGTVVALTLLAVIVCVGLVTAQEQKEEGILGKMKSVLPGGEEKAATKEEGSGMMEKMKKALPGGEKKAGAEGEGTGMMEKVKGILPGGAGK